MAVVLIITIKIKLTSQTFYTRSKEPTRCNQTTWNLKIIYVAVSFELARCEIEKHDSVRLKKSNYAKMMNKLMRF